MARTRRLAALTVVGVLTLGLTGATSAPREGEGQVSTRLQVLSLDLTDVPLAGDLDAALGTLTSQASTIDAHAASLLLEGLRAGDTSVAPWAASSSSGPATGNESLALPGGLGGVSLIDWLADADDRSATARVSALTGDLDLGPLVGLAVDLGERGVSSQVTEDRATGITEASIDGLRLDVGDLLPTGLLDELPLGLLLDLLDDLPITLPTDLTDPVAEVEALIAELEGVVALDGDVQDALAALLALPEVSSATEAEALVTALTALVAELETDLAAAQAALTLLDGLDLLDPVGLLDGLLVVQGQYGGVAGCGTVSALTLLPDMVAAVGCYTTYLDGLVTTLSGELATATADLAMVSGLLDDLTRLLDDLTGLLDDLTGLLGDLPDLAGLRDQLAGVLGGASLFDLGRLAIEVEVGADADGAHAAVTCTATDVEVLGWSPLPELDCDALGTTFAAVEAIVGDVLGALPIDLPVLVEVGGLSVTTAVDEDPEAGVNAGSASVSAFRAQVGSVGLGSITDLLTDQLGALLGEVTGIVDGLGLGADLADLADLLATVDDLPIGLGLDGLRTVGLDLQVASIDVQGDFAAAQAPDGEGPGDEGPGGEGPGGEGPGGEGPGGEGPGGDPGGDDPGGDGPGLDPVPVDAPGTPPPGVPVGAPNLPRTGGSGPAMLLGLALLGTGAVLRRPRRG